MLEQVLEFLRSGLSVIPVKADGSKAPGLRSFEEFKSKRRPTEAEITSWFSTEAKQGVGIICGKLSGNLVVMDFEQKEVYRTWSELCESEDLPVSSLPIVETPRGYHAYARLPETIKGQTLARQMVETEGKDGLHQVRPKVLVEFRGHGQYVVGPGSPPECHQLPGNSGWNLKWGPGITETPEITMAEWEGMVRCAKALNEVPEEGRIVDGLRKISQDDQRPGTDYCRRASMEDFQALLEKHGWTRLKDSRSGQIWKRPEKEEPGGSATLGSVTTSLGDCFFVFSTNAHPFQADTCYSIFATRALLEYGGDWHRAACQCRYEGYGKPAPDELRDEIQGFIGHWKDEDRLERLKTEVTNRCGVSQTFKKTWEGKRAKDIGDDPHRYTRALLFYAVRYLGTPEVSGLCIGVGFVKLWRQKFGQDPDRAEDAEYMARQASDVLSMAERTEEEMHAQLEAREAGESKDSRLKWLSERFGFRVDRWVQCRGNADEATYWLCSGERQIKIGDVRSWETYDGFNRALRGWVDTSTGEGVPGFQGLLPQSLSPRAVWQGVMIVLHKIREAEDLEDTTSVAILSWAVEYADGYGCWDEGERDDELNWWKQEALLGNPFILEDQLWLSLDGFCRWVMAQKSEKFSRRQLIDELRAGGFERLSKQPSDSEGRRRQKNFWTMPVDRLPRPDSDTQVPTE